MKRPLDAAAWAVAAVAVVTGLGAYGLVEPSDARYAEIAREMWTAGDWVFPRLLGILHFHKPPLVYWLSAAGYALLGPTEWGARLCLAVLAAGLAWVVYRFARKHLGPGCAPWAVLMLVTTPAVVGASRMLTTDLLVSLCQAVVLAAWFDLWAGTGGRGSRIALYLALGAGFLAKGPVAWLVPAAVVLAFCAAHRGQGKRRVPWGLPWGIPLVLAVATPWYAYVLWKTPGLLDYFLTSQLAGRLRAGGMGHPHPWHYYLLVFPALGLPWLVLAPRGARALGGARRATAGFLALWAVVPPVLFSVPATKLPLYVLPAYPAVALLAAAALGDPAAAPRREVRWLGAGFVVLALALGVVGLGAVPVRGGDLAGLAPDRAAALFLPLAGAVGVAGALALAWTASPRGPVSAAVLALAGALAFAPAWAFSRGDDLPVRSARTVGLAAAGQLRDGDVLVEYRDLAAGLPFYAGRMPVLAGIRRETRFEPRTAERLLSRDAFRALWAGPRRVLAVTRQKHRGGIPGGTELARGGGYVLVANR